jgi:hypothetical protein
MPPIPLNNELKNAPLLHLHVIESITFTNSEIFVINALGMVGTQRTNGKDGRVYIGKYNPRFSNDISMKDDESGVGDKHAMIYYNSSAQIIR